MVATPGWEKTVRFVDLAILMIYIYIYIHNINGAAPPRLGELGGQGTIQSEKSVQVLYMPTWSTYLLPDPSLNYWRAESYDWACLEGSQELVSSRCECLACLTPAATLTSSRVCMMFSDQKMWQVSLSGTTNARLLSPNSPNAQAPVILKFWSCAISIPFGDFASALVPCNYKSKDFNCNENRINVDYHLFNAIMVNVLLMYI